MFKNPFSNLSRACVLFLTLILGGACFVIGSGFWKIPSAVPATNQAVLPNVSSSVVSNSITGTSFVAVSQQLKDIVTVENPTAAFSALETFIAHDPNMAGECHDLTHVIGDAAYLKYGNFKDAMVFNNYMCGSGYIHSLVVNVLQGASDPTTIINSVCAGQDGYCYHGIGHGLMFFTDNDVPKALDYCVTLDTPEHAARCSEGVFMQNFEPGQDDPTPYVYATDPLKLCRDEPRFKTACYLYAGEYLATDWRTNPDLFSQCDASEPAFYGKCISGMGAYVMAVHLDNPKTAEHICDTGKNQTIKDACIDGLVSYDLVNDNSISKTEALCVSMETGNQATCEASLAARKQYYQ